MDLILWPQCEMSLIVEGGPRALLVGKENIHRNWNDGKKKRRTTSDSRQGT